MPRLASRSVVITGSTGYLRRPLAALAVARGHAVRAFVRPGSESKVPAGATVISGDPLAPAQLAGAIGHGDTLVHLIGTLRPSPAKARQFVDVDLASIGAACEAATGVAHFVYVSVAHPAPIMRAYIEARMRGEALVHATGIPATILRPWYVLGPGHRWPCALLPFYWLSERLPSTRETAERLGLVTRAEMTTALMCAVERGAEGAGLVDVPAVRAAGLPEGALPPC
jgi:uncharacterized protein YbjT (DUF2867 family)